MITTAVAIARGAHHIVDREFATGMVVQGVVDWDAAAGICISNSGQCFQLVDCMSHGERGAASALIESTDCFLATTLVVERECNECQPKCNSSPKDTFFEPVGSLLCTREGDASHCLFGSGAGEGKLVRIGSCS